MPRPDRARAELAAIRRAAPSPERHVVEGTVSTCGWKERPMPADAARPPLLIALTCTLAELEAIERGLARECPHWYPSTPEGRVVHALHRRVRLEIVEAQTGMFRLRAPEGAAE